MLSVNNLSIQFGKRILFDKVNLTFTHGNCYGVIGANGAGKSTFLRALSGQLDPTSGHVSLETDKRMSVLEQNHNAYDEYPVLETVLRGNTTLFDIKTKLDALYAKPDFSDEDGIKAGNLSMKYEEMGGWDAESSASELLFSLQISQDLHYKTMTELTGQDKVKVLLAQALFGNPDLLILDEPTNDLDFQTILWLENFLVNYDHTVIVVSHDRHFLDNVCTHMLDIDFNKINLFTGNYTFWYESSQLALKQKSQANKKAEEKKKELEDFIARFSANASKSKQATSRKKLLDKINIDQIKPSSRRYPAIIFKPEKMLGDQILNVEGLGKMGEDSIYFQNISFRLKKKDKVAIICENSLATTLFYEMLIGQAEPDEGTIEWGITTRTAYFPTDNHVFFDKNLSLVDWLRQYTEKEEEQDELFIRGFLGKMLFSGDEALKKCNVLSGGEKSRCMLSKMMLKSGNVLLLDEPTNHLDLESISTLNNSLIDFPGVAIFTSKDMTFTNTLANRIIEITPYGTIDREMNYEEYLHDPAIQTLKEEMKTRHQQDAS